MHQSENASSTSDDDLVQRTLAKEQYPKKRKQKLKKYQIGKEKRLRSHNTGKPSGCALLKFFEVNTAEERGCLIMTFYNQYNSIDKQNAYFSIADSNFT